MSSNSGTTNMRNNPYKNNKLFIMILIGIVILFIIMFIYSSYVGFVNYQKYSPYLIDGISDATVAQKFSAYQIQPSSDSAYGTEFTYSFWMYIKDTNFSSNASSNSSCSKNTSLYHVFHKGSYDYIPTGSQSGATNSVYYPLLQMPGVWLYPNTNKLNIRFNTYENVVETSDIGNIPLNMWVNIIIILIGSSVDIYVNGNLKKRTKLSGVPKINYGDFYTTNWGGFQGYLSRLRYFNYAIQPYLVDQIYSMGPSTTFTTNSSTNSSITNGPPQLSSNYWMTTGYPNSAGAPGFNQSSTTSN
jgi:hypothetical protein